MNVSVMLLFVGPAGYLTLYFYIVAVTMYEGMGYTVFRRVRDYYSGGVQPPEDAYGESPSVYYALLFVWTDTTSTLIQTRHAETLLARQRA